MTTGSAFQPRISESWWRNSAPSSSTSQSGHRRSISSSAQRELPLVGHAEQHPDDPHRNERGQVADDVEAAGADVQVEDVGVTRM